MECRKNTESKNPKVLKTKNGRIMFLSKCSVFNDEKSKFLKEQRARELLINLTGVKISYRKKSLTFTFKKILYLKSIKWMQY